MSEENIAVVKKFIDEVWNKGNLRAITSLVAGTCPPGTLSGEDFGIRATSGHDFLEEYVKAFRSAFPDLNVHIDEIFAAGDKVVRRATWRGTHKGKFMGKEPTGRAVTFNEIAIVCMSHGKIGGGCELTSSILQQIS